MPDSAPLSPPDPAGLPIRSDDSIRVLVADGHPLFRSGLAHALAQTGDLTVTAEAGSTDEALARAMALRPDLILLDLALPGGAWRLIEAILANWPSARIAAMTANEQPEEMLATLRAGAKAYLAKGLSAPMLCEALRGVARGEGYVPPALAARLLGGLRHGHGQGHGNGPGHGHGAPPCRASARKAALALLTRREREVLEALAAGQSNKEIALRHQLQEKTVKNHVSHILRKLQARNRTEAALVLRGRLHHAESPGPFSP